MSLGIAIKGPEGLVLAADSRVTLFTQMPPIAAGQPPMLITSTFDHATKLLRVQSEIHKHFAAVTFGAGAIGQISPRTARSFMPEFEQELPEEKMTVAKFAKELSDFFLSQWNEAKMPTNLPPENDMFFYVGGYDGDEPYGKIYSFSVPSAIEPVLTMAEGAFGAVWGGQREITDRLIQGFDPRVPGFVEDILAIPAPQRNTRVLNDQLKARTGASIPWQFLPLQDCVDLAMLLVRTTISYQRFTVGIRAVGGAIDVATITREGVNEIQTKQISGEREHPTGRSRIQ